jgi:hypothetical protein
MWEPTSGVDLSRVNIKTLRNSNLEIMFHGFLMDKIHIWENSKKNGLFHLGYIIAYLIILFFLFILTI